MDGEEEVVTYKIRMGKKFREGYGIARSWYFYECEACGDTYWCLNLEATRAAAKDHLLDHQQELV